MLDKVEKWPVRNYGEVVEERNKRLIWLAQDPERIEAAKILYRKDAIRFIEHWGVVREPRSTDTDSPSVIPFVPFQRQRDLLKFFLMLLKDRESGLVEKSRDMGATWCGVLFSVWLYLFWPGSTVGWGSRDADLVDRKGDPDSIIEKIRIALAHVPRVFLPQGFSFREHTPFMRILNPETNATIVGDVGDNIGRGGRSLIYFKDESAHYQHPDMIEAALNDNALVQIDISSVYGVGTVFNRKREAGVEWYPGAKLPKGKTRVIVMDWRDHPGKTQEWYDLKRNKMVEEGLLHVFAQEVDRDYSAAVSGTIIPALWIREAIDAHIKLGFSDDGGWCAALDVADDEDGDTNALSKRKGVVLRGVEEWGERDTGVTTRRAIDGCKGVLPLDLQYDCIGVGAGVKSEYNRLKDEQLVPKGLRLIPWNAGAEVVGKGTRLIRGDKQSPLVEDFFHNLKAQAWWALRRRFELTYRALHEKDFTWDSDDLISIDSRIPLLRKIEKELAQPTKGVSSKLRMIVNKKPQGAKSPNIGDSIVMNYFPIKSGQVIIPDAAIARLQAMSRARMLGHGRR